MFHITVTNNPQIEACFHCWWLWSQSSCISCSWEKLVSELSHWENQLAFTFLIMWQMPEFTRCYSINRFSISLNLFSLEKVSFGFLVASFQDAIVNSFYIQSWRRKKLNTVPLIFVLLLCNMVKITTAAQLMQMPQCISSSFLVLFWFKFSV